MRCYARPVSPGGPGFQAIKTPPSNAWAGNNPGLLTNVLVGSPELAPLSWSGKQLPQNSEARVLAFVTNGVAAPHTLCAVRCARFRPYPIASHGLAGGLDGFAEAAFMRASAAFAIGPPSAAAFFQQINALRWFLFKPYPSAYQSPR